MINAASKAAYLRATTQVVNGGIKPLVAAGLTHSETKVEHKSTPLANSLPSGLLRVQSGPAGNVSFPSTDLNKLRCTTNLKVRLHNNRVEVMF